MRTGVALERLMTVRQAAARSGVPRRTLYQWIATGRMWSIKVGTYTMVHADDVDLLTTGRVNHDHE